MDIGQFLKRNSICDSRSVENNSDKRLRIEVQTEQTNGEERVKRLLNVYLHCIVTKLKMISKISTLHPSGKISGTPMGTVLKLH